jgi:restriction endonuclease Mrr
MPKELSFCRAGQQAILNNRVAWASTYLKKAGLLCATYTVKRIDNDFFESI